MGADVLVLLVPSPLQAVVCCVRVRCVTQRGWGALAAARLYPTMSHLVMTALVSCCSLVQTWVARAHSYDRSAWQLYWHRCVTASGCHAQHMMYVIYHPKHTCHLFFSISLTHTSVH